VLTHCCLEPHGQTIAVNGDKAEYWPSTQNVYGISTDVGKALNIPVTNIHVHMDYMGGGFGSKFPADSWGIQSALLSKDSGGKPVKLFLDRATELTVAGNRPSVFSKVKVAGKKDGTLTAWQSETWSTGGMGGGNLNGQLFPYIFTGVPNRRINHTAVSTNTGSSRAWRAPSHPQVCYITCSALEDLAAKLNMDPLDLFTKNIGYAPEPRRETYKFQLQKAAELMDWKKNWHPRGDSGSGHVKRGLGLALSTWGGAGHLSTCKTTIHPDASGRGRTGHSGSRHRNADYGRHDRGRNFRTASKRDQGQAGRQRLSELRRVRRIHYRRRRNFVHAQGLRQCAAETLRDRCGIPERVS